MKVYYNIAEFKQLKNAVVTIGTFDGVHKGHQKILNRLTKLASEKKGESVVLTFWPHPRQVLNPESKDIRVLSTVQEKIELLASQHIDHLLIIPFNKEFSDLTSDEFIELILVNKIGTKQLIIGYDHKFGKNRTGGLEQLKACSSRYGFEVEEISREDIQNVGISSTIIRKALLDGDVKTALEYLGRPYSFSGIVMHGKQLGRTIGFPTANISINDSSKLIPSDGVYAVLIKVEDNIFKGMMNIGFRPTVNGKDRVIEVNIFDFKKDIYGMEVRVDLIAYLRQEEKYSSIDILKEQLFKDKEASLEILSKY
jgi:riboflavin kinase / FMN adenylyltransferase